MKFYKCDVCGKIMVMLHETPIPTMCCGQPMKEMVPGAVDGAHEKHIPVVEQNGKNIMVKVGEVEHPMMEKHYIEFIVLETTEGFYQKALKPEIKPVANFVLNDTEKAIAAYEYCNLHGLWIKEL